MDPADAVAEWEIAGGIAAQAPALEELFVCPADAPGTRVETRRGGVPLA
jgi:hypothetical protein